MCGAKAFIKKSAEEIRSTDKKIKRQSKEILEYFCCSFIKEMQSVLIFFIFNKQKAC